MLKSVLTDCRQIKNELKALQEYIDNYSADQVRDIGSDLINRVKAILEKKDLRHLSNTCSGIDKLISFKMDD